MPANSRSTAEKNDALRSALDAEDSDPKPYLTYLVTVGTDGVEATKARDKAIMALAKAYNATEVKFQDSRAADADQLSKEIGLIYVTVPGFGELTAKSGVFT